MTVCIVCTSFLEWRWVKALKAQAKLADLDFVHLPAAYSWHGNEKDVMGLGAWPNEAHQRNDALYRAWDKKHEWAITLDADEVLTVDDFHALESFLTALPKDKNIVLAGKMVTFFRSVDWRVTPAETHQPVIAVRNPQEPFKSARCVHPGMPMETWNGGTLWHSSWARPEAEILMKLKTFSHAPEIRKGWYEEVWKPWTPASKNFHPLGNGSAYQGVCLSEAPDEIRKWWKQGMGGST